MLDIEIISASGVVFEGQCHMAVVPSVAGDIGVMQNHEAFVAQLKAGKVVVYNDLKDIVKSIEINAGTAEIHDGKKLLVLAD